MHCRRFIAPGLSRRDLLLRSGFGFGALALASLARSPAFGSLLGEAPAESVPDRSKAGSGPLAPGLPTFRLKPQTSSFCSWTAGHRRWIRLTPSPVSTANTDSRSRSRRTPLSSTTSATCSAVPGNSGTMARAVSPSATCFRMSVPVPTTWRSSGRWSRISRSTRPLIISCIPVAACRGGPVTVRGSPMASAASARICRRLWS